MTPIDLTKRPPRSPYEMMEGLLMMPRTVDKLRAKLPGGNIGAYTVRGSSELLAGLSLVLLNGIGLTEEALFDVVAHASLEEEVAKWIRMHADFSEQEALNESLLARKIADVRKFFPVEAIYPCAAELPDATSTFDVIVEDDHRAFPGAFN